MMIKQRVRLMTALMLIFALTTTAITYAQDTAAKDPITPIKDYLVYLTNGGNFSGSVLIARGDDILLNEAYGMANIEWSVPNTSDGKFKIASISKQFIATAILMLQEQNQLHIEDLICTYLKDCPAVWADITIDQLLTQTDGIPELSNTSTDTSLMQPLKPSQWTSMLAAKPLTSQPGTIWADENSGYLVLGQIITDLAGKPYQRFLKDNIFDPLGMTNTGYENPKQVVKQLITGYINRLTTADPINPNLFEAAGAFYSTTGDLFRWTQALFHGKVVSTKTLETLLEKLNSFTDSKGARYGFELATDQGHRYLHKESIVAGFTSTVYYYLDDDVTVIVLGNIETARPAELVETIFRFIFKVA